MKKLPFFRPFQVKVTIALILAMIFPLLLSNLLIYKFTADSAFDSLRNRLKLIAQLAAEQIDSAMLEEIPLNRDGIHTPQFQNIAAKLEKIKKIGSQVTYIYILKKTTKEGIWQFVVDPNYALTKHYYTLTSFPGDTYDARRFPEMLQAFDRPSADRKLENDQWGKTLSGYAPIYNAQKKAIAILGVDVLAEDVYQMQNEVKRRTVLILIISLGLCLLLGTILSARITNPVERLVEGTRHLAKGNLNHQVKISGDDELAELAASFNHMAKNLRESRRRIISYFYNIIRMLVRIMEVKDHYTRGHSEEVARYSAKIAAKMGYPKETIKVFRRMTLLHDIGKLGITDAILNKVAPLSAEEWETIKKHPGLGETILKPIFRQDEMLAVVKEHHERHDGKGYPNQLAGEQINAFAAIVSVADAFSAMTSDRSYRKALPLKAAIEELKKNKGTQFDPAVVDKFLEILEEEKD